MHIFDNLKQYDTRNRPQPKFDAPISDEVRAYNERVEKDAKKEKLLSSIFVPLFFIVFIGGIIAIANSESIQYLLAGGAILVAFAFIFFVSYVLLTNAKHRRWKRIVIAAVIGLVVIGLLILIGSVLPDSYVNDAHRPDRF